MKASAIVNYLREMAEATESGADVLLHAAEQIVRDQAMLQALRDGVERLHELIPAEPTR